MQKTISFKDAADKSYSSSIDAGTQAALSVKLSSVGNIASSTAASGTITVSDYSSITASTAATATITVTSSNITLGDPITLVDSNGISHIFTAVATLGDVTSEYVLDTSNSSTTATNLSNAINSKRSFSTSVSSNQIVVTQSAAGSAGNTTITISDASGSVGLAAAGSAFSSGADGTKIVFTDSRGTVCNLLADSNTTSGESSSSELFASSVDASNTNNLVFKIGTSNSDTAANIETALSSVSIFETAVTNNVVSVTQRVGGTSGNESITENSSGISAVGFSGANAGDSFTFTTRHSDSVVLVAGQDFFIDSSSRENTRDSLLGAINRDAILKANFLASTDECELGTVSLVARRPGTADNSNTVSFSSSTAAAGDVTIQSTSNSASSGVSAHSFSGGAASAATSATVVGVSSITSPASLATEINTSISSAISSGLGITSAASSNVVSLSMTTSGSVGNKAVEGTLFSSGQARQTGFSGGADNVDVGSNKADYATNLAARINSTIGTFVTASIGTSVTLTSPRHQPTGKVTFATSSLGSYNGQTITITGIDRTRTYQFSEDCGDTGNLSGSNVMVYLGNISNYTTPTVSLLSEEFVRALNHRNGHGFNIMSKKGLAAGSLILFLKHGTSKTISAMSKSMSDSVLSKEDISPLTAIPLTITMQKAGDFRDDTPARVSPDTFFFDKASGTACRTCDDTFEEGSFSDGSKDHYKTGPIGGQDASVIDWDNTRGGETTIATDYLNPNWQSFYADGTAVDSGLLNDILVKRNGIYGNPTFKQYIEEQPRGPGGNYIGTTPPDYRSTESVPDMGPGLIPEENPNPSGDRSQGDGYENYTPIVIGSIGFTPWVLNPFVPDGHQPGDEPVPHLQTKKTQLFYEPAIEDRHKPLLYSFQPDNASVSLAKQTLFNGLHFFSNQAINLIYKIKDSDARSTHVLSGSLRKGHIFDLFKAAHQAGASEFKLRERIFPREMNSRRVGLRKRPDYNEVETVLDAEFVAHEPNIAIDPAKKLTLVRNFWRTNQKDRVRNIRQKVDGSGEYVTPTGSLGSIYDRSPLTQDGKYHEVRQNSHGFFAYSKPQKGPNMTYEDAVKHHIAAGISTHYQDARMPNVDQSLYITASGDQPAGPLLAGFANAGKITPLSIKSSVIRTNTLNTSVFEGYGNVPWPEQVPVVSFIVDGETYVDESGATQDRLIKIGRETHYNQPFDFSLLSVWPLDYPEYLWRASEATPPAFNQIVGAFIADLSNDDGPFVRGVQRVGLAPNRIAPSTLAEDPYAFIRK